MRHTVRFIRTPARRRVARTLPKDGLRVQFRGRGWYAQVRCTKRTECEEACRQAADIPQARPPPFASDRLRASRTNWHGRTGAQCGSTAAQPITWRNRRRARKAHDVERVRFYRSRSTMTALAPSPAASPLYAADARIETRLTAVFRQITVEGAQTKRAAPKGGPDVVSAAAALRPRRGPDPRWRQRPRARERRDRREPCGPPRSRPWTAR